MHASNAYCYVFEQLGELNFEHTCNGEWNEWERKKIDKFKDFCKIMFIKYLQTMFWIINVNYYYYHYDLNSGHKSKNLGSKTLSSTSHCIPFHFNSFEIRMGARMTRPLTPKLFANLFRIHKNQNIGPGVA